MESVIQGQIIKVMGSTFFVKTKSDKDLCVIANEHTRNNGWPSVGDHILSVVKEDGTVLLMTRYRYSQYQAA